MIPAQVTKPVTAPLRRRRSAKPRLLTTLLLRLLLAIGVVVIVAFVALAIPRWARPDLYVGETGLAGAWHAMGRAFLHFDFGVACNWAGCPKVADMW